jgi:hypothetical protein
MTKILKFSDIKAPNHFAEDITGIVLLSEVDIMKNA